MDLYWPSWNGAWKAEAGFLTLVLMSVESVTTDKHDSSLCFNFIFQSGHWMREKI